MSKDQNISLKEAEDKFKTFSENGKRKYTKVEMGVYTMYIEKSSSMIKQFIPSSRLIKRILTFNLSESWSQTDSDTKSVDGIFSKQIQSARYIWKFLAEIYSLKPLYFYIVIFSGIWDIINSALSLYLKSQLLDLIGRCLEKHEFLQAEISTVLLEHILLTVLVEVLYRYKVKCSASYRTLIDLHFNAKTIHSSLNFDLTTMEDPEVQTKIGPQSRKLSSQIWDTPYGAFLGIFEVLFGFLKIISNLTMVTATAKKDSILVLSLILCLARPLALAIDQIFMSINSCVAFSTNPYFSRLTALHSLVFNENYREDIQSNSYDSFIEKEFDKNRKELGELTIDGPYWQWWNSKPLLLVIATELSSEFPLMFFAMKVINNPDRLSMGSLILLQQTTDSVHSTTVSLIWRFRDLSDHLMHIRNLYTLSEVSNSMKGGDVVFPSALECPKGTEIEFKNVSFSYPGTDKEVLSDVSFHIKPGQLVVIVGVNGSGKSSTIKLLSRLHDPTKGEILFDGLPLPSYRLKDIRRSSAILKQDHPVLPLSLRENVALGNTECEPTDEEVHSAIEQGGAGHFLGKLKAGLESVIAPIPISSTIGEPDAAVKKIVKELEKSSDISGGESQRLSASRTFMKLMGGNVRLLVADEPTSALDPEGEYELFNRLRQHSGGKTVIFITHRFGHLTKYADLILCLKDGKLVEQGTHESLLAADGEYKKLHDIQAKAFIDN